MFSMQSNHSLMILTIRCIAALCCVSAAFGTNSDHRGRVNFYSGGYVPSVTSSRNVAFVDFENTVSPSKLYEIYGPPEERDGTEDLSVLTIHALRLLKASGLSSVVVSVLKPHEVLANVRQLFPEGMGVDLNLPVVAASEFLRSTSPINFKNIGTAPPLVQEYAVKLVVMIGTIIQSYANPTRGKLSYVVEDAKGELTRSIDTAYRNTPSRHGDFEKVSAIHDALMTGKDLTGTRHYLKEIRKKKPDLQVVVIGTYASMLVADTLREVFGLRCMSIEFSNPGQAMFGTASSLIKQWRLALTQIGNLKENASVSVANVRRPLVGKKRKGLLNRLTI